MIIDKGWGHENIFVSNDDYCGKLLVFDKDKEFSMHFHVDKKETWYVLEGFFELELLNTGDASIIKKTLNTGDVWTNERLEPHRLRCVGDKGVILEVSTKDTKEDNYRVFPGDSQR
jgi:quercetin dioxygenase-like cupin family protein